MIWLLISTNLLWLISFHYYRTKVREYSKTALNEARIDELRHVRVETLDKVVYETPTGHITIDERIAQLKASKG